MPKYLLLKILFAVGFAYSVIFHVSLHTNSYFENSSQTRVSWVQPAALNASYPIAISNQGLGFNYKEIEKIVWQFSKTDDENTGGKQLLVNAESAKQLELTCSHVQENVSTTDLQRFEFLITKSVPGKPGQQLNNLMVDYCDYLQRHRVSLAKINSTQGDEKLALLASFMSETEKLQSELFSDKNSRELFATKNSNLSYFTNSRIINLRQDLTQDEKKSKLLSLQEAYKKELQK